MACGLDSICEGISVQVNRSSGQIKHEALTLSLLEMCPKRQSFTSERRHRAQRNGWSCERRQTVMKWLFIPVSGQYEVNKHAVGQPLYWCDGSFALHVCVQMSFSSFFCLWCLMIGMCLCDQWKNKLVEANSSVTPGHETRVQSRSKHGQQNIHILVLCTVFSLELTNLTRSQTSLCLKCFWLFTFLTWTSSF